MNPQEFCTKHKACPTHVEMHAADWNDYIRFWRIIYPGARTEATSRKSPK